MKKHLILIALIFSTGLVSANLQNDYKHGYEKTTHNNEPVHAFDNHNGQETYALQTVANNTVVYVTYQNGDSELTLYNLSSGNAISSNIQNNKKLFDLQLDRNNKYIFAFDKTSNYLERYNYKNDTLSYNNVRTDATDQLSSNDMRYDYMDYSENREEILITVEDYDNFDGHILQYDSDLNFKNKFTNEKNYGSTYQMQKYAQGTNNIIAVTSSGSIQSFDYSLNRSDHKETDDDFRYNSLAYDKSSDRIFLTEGGGRRSNGTYENGSMKYKYVPSNHTLYDISDPTNITRTDKLDQFREEYYSTDSVFEDVENDYSTNVNKSLQIYEKDLSDKIELDSHSIANITSISSHGGIITYVDNKSNIGQYYSTSNVETYESTSNDSNDTGNNDSTNSDDSTTGSKATGSSTSSSSGNVIEIISIVFASMLIYYLVEKFI